MAISPPLLKGLPAWPRRIQLLRRGALVLSTAAVLGDLASAVYVHAPWGVFPALATSLGGVLLTPRRPGLGLVVTIGAVCLAVATGADPTGLWTVAVFTLFSATLAGVSPLLAGLLVSASLYAVVGWSHLHGYDSVGAITAAVGSVAAAGVGGGLRAQGRYWRIFEQRAIDSAGQAVIAERLRIARDLHDLVGHEIAAVNMHIGMAEVSLPPGATAAAAALEEARRSVQSVLSETQQILVLLRRGDTAPDRDDPSQPVPGTEQLAQLVDSAQRLGLRVDADLRALDGWRPDPSVGVTLYRVVQEALTNASRYSDGTARLGLHRTGGTVTLTVDNPDHGQDHHDTPGSGYGLLGMQERLSAIGGDLHVRTSDRTFHLTATFPTHPRSR